MLVGIHAVNINTGGALVLLCELLKRVEPYSTRVDVYVHVSFDITKIEFQSSKINYLYKRNLFSSLFFPNKYDRTLFFGNLPPLNYVKNSTTYIHNIYLTIPNKKQFNLPLKMRLKFFLLRSYINFFKKNSQFLVCQTRNMKNLFSNFYNSEIHISPFYKKMKIEKANILYDFCFIGLPSPHKKYNFLLDCLEMISRRNIKCSIFITVPFDPKNNDILKRIDIINKEGNIKIENYGLISSCKINEVFNSSKSLIFPSTTESFGLPIIEATQLGMHILAPNIDYVNDVVSDFIEIDLNDINHTAEVMIDFVKNPNNFPKTNLKITNNFPEKFLTGSGYD